jgi:hypothetical protein
MTHTGRSWVWCIEELDETRITATCAERHEREGRTVTIVQAGESDD